MSDSATADLSAGSEQSGPASGPLPTDSAAAAISAAARFDTPDTLDSSDSPSGGPAKRRAGRPGGLSILRSGPRSRRLDILGLLPFAAYVLVFLGAPTYAVLTAAFKDDSGKFTTHNVTATLQDPYRHAFVVSIELSIVSALAGAVLGLALAFAVSGSKRDGFFHRAITTASGVLAYFGGLPLAFVFLATLGPAGLATKWLTSAGFDLYQHGFALYNFAGLVLVYLYFQIPLMLLVIFPALDGLRPQWEEAARNLGATRRQYWLRVGGPLLMPPFLGAVMLLFANSFAAYATAYALSTGSIPLVPLQIGSVMSGNVIAGEQNIGNALGMWMILIVGLVVVGYVLLQRRTARWLR